MHSRILLGAAAWLAGAGTATAGSLLAVSMLGQGMTPAAGEQLGVPAVDRALAIEAAERARAARRPPASKRRPVSQRRQVSPRSSSTGPPRAAAGSPVPAPPPGTGGGTVLTSEGGTLVAGCDGPRAYLVSWSPQPGFGSGDVIRGPATNAVVTFIGGQLTVTMDVSCYAGEPTATTTTVGAGSTGSNDGMNGVGGGDGG
jgi:hypothetical protein